MITGVWEDGKVSMEKKQAKDYSIAVCTVAGTSGRNWERASNDASWGDN